MIAFIKDNASVTAVGQFGGICLLEGLDQVGLAVEKHSVLVFLLFVPGDSDSATAFGLGGKVAGSWVDPILAFLLTDRLPLFGPLFQRSVAVKPSTFLVSLPDMS